ncbi:hypothetical protein IV203_031450 [Nitzschia inconspicua]|uniref:Uncharacterized protein n=1 Tax=Nitzschia inconspicua TaxID=303405 RepID=A0A9K3LV77_9STRA|nr:hypothetical protein IV203_031450 [Nitzschia inconspicua]
MESLRRRSSVTPPFIHDSRCSDMHEEDLLTSLTMSSLTLHTQQQQQLAEAQKPPRPRVRFSFVTIRNYDITMGDNPSVTAGPPITLGWSYEQLPSLPLREFETFRDANPRAVDSHCLMISADDRRNMLKRAGFTDNQIQQNEKRVMKIQKQRARTRMSFPFHCVEHAMRSAGRKLQRSTGRQSFPSSGYHNAKFTGKYAPEDAALSHDNATISTGSMTEHDYAVLGMGPW